MVKRSLKFAEVFFAVVGAVCTMYFVAICLMQEATEKVREEEELDDYIDPQPDDDEDDDEVPDDDGK